LSTRSADRQLGSGITIAPRIKGGAEILANAETRVALTLRLEDAGMTMLVLPASGHCIKLRVTLCDIVQAAGDAYGWQPSRLRLAYPAAAASDRMDEAFAWLTLIPEERYVLRCICSARALIHPITRRHLYTWRRLGTLLGADHKSVQRWHGEALGFDPRWPSRNHHPNGDDPPGYRYRLANAVA